MLLSSRTTAIARITGVCHGRQVLLSYSFVRSSIEISAPFYPPVSPCRRCAIPRPNPKLFIRGISILHLSISRHHYELRDALERPVGRELPASPGLDFVSLYTFMRSGAPREFPEP